MSLIRYSMLLCSFLCMGTSIQAFNFLFPSFSPRVQRQVTIMIDPAGDAQRTGRRIDDTFERSVALQCAQQLKQTLESQYSNVRIVLTRSAGEVVQTLQNANFANRLNVDFYLSLHFYQEQETKPKLYLYNFSYNDDFISKKNDLSFCSYDQAHLFNYSTTRNYGALMKNVLEGESYKKFFESKGLCKLPFKPLIGIKSPALALEAGLTHKENWQTYIEPLEHCLKAIIEQIQAS